MVHSENVCAMTMITIVRMITIVAILLHYYVVTLLYIINWPKYTTRILCYDFNLQLIL